MTRKLCFKTNFVVLVGEGRRLQGFPTHAVIINDAVLAAANLNKALHTSILSFQNKIS